MAKRIYLDHAATSPVDPAVLSEMTPYFTELYGNASSSHREGRQALSAVDLARERVASAIKASPAEIFFTSGGTESDNWAVFGVAEAYPERKHLIASSIEHPAMIEALRRLEGRGYEITYLPVNEEGRISLSDAVAAMRADTLLVSVMLANNEVGSIQPVKELAREAHSRGILVHTDAVQAVGAIPVDVNDLGVDLLSLSAHKFYGPKGVGALYLRSGTKIKGFHLGGEQERSFRAGTYNTPAIVGMGAAIALASEHLTENAAYLASLKSAFVKGIEEIPCAAVNGGKPALPGIVNLRFSGVRNSELLSALDLKGISASAGSACSAGSVEPSRVLTAMGLGKEEVLSSLRFSFGRENTFEEVELTLAALKEILSPLVKDADLFLQKKAEKTNL